ncbi:MAG: A/G-specific adenine glycosylase [Bacteroidetes bacterium]|nr:A/G-specific adenine glycosylase [Bacteroidota bacterium]
MDFGNRLAAWYQKNKRDLPWRNTNDPYRIWLSEIILQQTRVIQGLQYYFKFIEKYPDVFALAGASRDEVFKLWQGLGYYNRADNMLSTAIIIAEKYNGHFPSDYDALLKMPGIGPYTAAAVASIAFNLPRPVIDGNVYRVLSRVFGIDAVVNSPEGHTKFQQYAEDLLDRAAPSIYNQALMEFGALHCTPVNPGCNTCIFMGECYARLNGMVKDLPVKKPKNKVRNRFFYYFIIEPEPGGNENAKVYLRKRMNGDIWRNLYDFLLVETDHKLELNDAAIMHILKQNFNLENPLISLVSKAYIHKLTHQSIHATFIKVNVDKKLDKHEKFVILADKNKLSDYPVPRLIEQFLKDYKTL